jgi:murein DD-endopeptidase MepM/ murein hydrolase activator NlpD
VARAARRLAPRIVAVGVLVASCTSVASATPVVQQHLRARHRVDHRLDRLETGRAHHVRILVAERRQIEGRLEALSSPSVIRGRWWAAHRHLRRAIHAIDIRIARFRRFTERMRLDLARRRDDLATWIDTWGTFRRCPIDGPSEVADNFGIMVRLPGVPVHRHMGNDIGAATGTPIVAPFKGYATAGRSVLGGLEVRVQGDLGYVYNAHLSALGALGSVHTGEVIGYVGSTGDATSPHDHFEWHPNDGPAVDPNPLLSLVC